MSKESAGLLMYRLRDGRLELLLVHPGGPFWRRRDAGAWSIPKGELDGDEEPLAAACREFEEETGLRPEGPFLELPTIRQKAGKVVHAWAFEGDWDTSGLRSNTFEIEFPPGTGRLARYPEVDRAEFFSLATAREKVNKAQVPLIDHLAARVETS